MNKEMFNFLINAYTNRKKILKYSSIIFGIIFLYTFFIYDKSYKSKIVFVPQVFSEEGMSSKLSSLASFVGMSAQKNIQDVSPMLYSEIIKSKPFLNKIANKKITFNIDDRDTLMTYKDYYLLYKSESFLKKIKSFIFSEKKIKSITGSKIISYSQDDLSIFKELSKMINFSYNENENIMVITCTLHDAKTSSEILYETTELLKEEIINIKINKVRKELKFLNTRFSIKEKEFKQAQLQLASFEDKNNLLRTSKSQIKLLNLRANYDLIFSIFSELKKQIESVKLELKQKTPSFLVIEPISIPIKKTGMSRLIILIVGSLFSLVFGILIVLFKQEYFLLKNKFSNE